MVRQASISAAAGVTGGYAHQGVSFWAGALWGPPPRNEAELLGLVSTDSHARLAQVVNEPDEA